jgi:hypothetical protein
MHAVGDVRLLFVSLRIRFLRGVRALVPSPSPSRTQLATEDLPEKMWFGAIVLTRASWPCASWNAGTETILRTAR